MASYCKNDKFFEKHVGFIILALYINFEKIYYISFLYFYLCNFTSLLSSSILNYKITSIKSIFINQNFYK